MSVETSQGEQQLADLGEPHDRWERDMFTMAGVQLAYLKAYSSQMESDHKPWLKEAIAECEGYLLGLCYAIRARRDLTAPLH